jgi:DNA-binding LacI/PurR family transcriptional regulator
MATMADIAERAGVSLSTVSYTLSGKRAVSEETRQRILAAMDDLDYQPHALAQGLRARRSRTIALLFPASLARGLIETQLEFVTSAAQVASQQGYGLLLWTSPTEDQELRDLTRRGIIDGLILMEIKLHDARVSMLKKWNYPFVMIGRCEDNDGIAFVDLDFDHVLRTCVEHLVDLGHKHIVLVNYCAALLEAGYGPAVRFQSSFEVALKEYGLQGRAVLSESTPQAGYEITRNLIAEEPTVSAIVTVNERAIGGITQALLDSGRRIPDEISLVAVASPWRAEVATPALTTVDFPAAEQGRLAAEMLIGKLEGRDDGARQIVMQARLTERQSSGPYKGAVKEIMRVGMRSDAR